MSSTHIFELRGEPDRYPGFLQVYRSESEPWKEDIATRCLELGGKSFGASYTPVPFEFDNEGRKKNVAGDICLRMNPFIILSEKARLVLNDFLTPAGEFLEIAMPIPGFIGYHVLREIHDCIDLDLSKYMEYDNGAIIVRKAVMFEAKVRGLDIFSVANTQAGVFVSSTFKAAVMAAKLKGFDWSREVPLTE